MFGIGVVSQHPGIQKCSAALEVANLENLTLKLGDGISLNLATERSANFYLSDGKYPSRALTK